jgi:phosphopantetheinyl transferase (holo-ACP synthase)
MTGNDIVDLATAAVESNWKRKGFLDKLFTLKEQQYINGCTFPDAMVWRLWSMKESAYKIHIRKCGERLFAPQKFRCSLLSQTAGIVEYHNNSYQTNSITAKDYVYSTAKRTGIENGEFIDSCFYLPKVVYLNQQQFIYKKVIDHYKTVTGDLQKNISVVKDKNGIPFLNCNSKFQIPVSITHHGNYAAFTIN